MVYCYCMEKHENNPPEVKEIWEAWVAPRFGRYQEPERLGTPRGELIGLSRKKFYAAQTQVLHSKLFSLAALAEESGVSAVQIRVWRTEAEFKRSMEEAAGDFVEYLSEGALKELQDEKRFDTILYCLAMQKDGLLKLFLKWNKEASNTFNQLIDNINDVINYKRLFDNMSFIRMFIHKFIALHSLEEQDRVKDVIIRQLWPHMQNIFRVILEIVAKRDTNDKIKEEGKKILTTIALCNWTISL
jgi:hypothetical protein